MIEKIQLLLLYFSEFIRNGYTFSIFILGLIYLFRINILPARKEKLLELVNFSIIVYAFAGLIVWLFEYVPMDDSIKYERNAFLNRALGPYWWSFWIMMISNFILPQLFWFEQIRKNMIFSFLIMMLILINQWVVRIIIIFTSSHRDYITSSWDMQYFSFSSFISSLPLIFIFCILILLLHLFISKRKKQYAESSD